MKVTSTEAKLLYKHDAWLGEGPVWDEKEEKLYWVDILHGTLLVYDPAGQSNREYGMNEHLGAVALREKGGLIMARKTGFAFFNPETEEIKKILNPEENVSGNRFNDGKCDPSGRFWAGTLSYELTKGAGSLYCLDGSLNAERKLHGLTLPNGMAWNREKDTFFFIDSPRNKIFSFDYDNETGRISGQKVVKTFPAEAGSPDGMTIDEEDCLWVALYGAGKVIRLNPENGNTLYEVHLPAPHVTSCTFGGSGFNELYITTARENMSARQIKNAPLSGSLFKARIPYKGFPVFRFKG